MAARFPLIVDGSGTPAIEEIASGDVLDLTGCQVKLGTEATLTDGSTVSWDVSTSPIAKVTLGGNRTLAAPSNAVGSGQYISLLVIQDGTGSRTMSYGDAYNFAGGTAPTLTTNASAVDLLIYKVREVSSVDVASILNLS